MKFCKFTRVSLLVGAVLAATVTISASPALAQDAKLIGRYGDWEAYTRGGKDDRFCYIVSKPKEASLRSRRGDIFLLVWHRPAKKEFDVVQVDAGYSFKEKTEVELKVGSDEWKLFTRDGNAWTYRGDDDASIVEAMRKGSRLTVKGTSSRNNPTTDSYSLKGVTAAHRAMNKACGRS
ncbi:MAG: invasion associated locus B family protein [Alphaproteobacteria bacterium]|nr:invasion associated locus B family protein [Alphaproteobacteria bacterium]